MFGILQSVSYVWKWTIQDYSGSIRDATMEETRDVNDESELRPMLMKRMYVPHLIVHQLKEVNPPYHTTELFCDLDNMVTDWDFTTKVLCKLGNAFLCIFPCASIFVHVNSLSVVACLINCIQIATFLGQRNMGPTWPTSALCKPCHDLLHASHFHIFCVQNSSYIYIYCYFLTAK